MGVIGSGDFVQAEVDVAGVRTAISDCITAGPDNDSWPRALTITPGSTQGRLTAQGQSRWYKFAVTPGARVSSTLSNLPAELRPGVVQGHRAGLQQL